MKKIMNFVIGGIQHKVFNLVLFTTLFLMAVYTIVIVQQSNSLSRLVAESNKDQQEAIAQITTETMEAVVSQTLSRSTMLESYICDYIFSDIRMDVELLTHETLQLLEDPAGYKPRPAAPPLAENDGKVIAQYLCEEGIDLEDETIQDQDALLGNLTSIMESLILHEEHLGAIYIGTAHGTLIITDVRSGQKVDEEGEPIHVDVRNRYWYKAAVEKGELCFTNVEWDIFTNNINITCACPIYQDDELVAVIGADLFLNELEAAIEESVSDSGFEFVLNQDGRVIFSPVDEGIFQVHTAGEGMDLRESENEALSDFVRDALKGTTEVREIGVDGQDYYMTGAAMPTLGWTLISVVDKTATDLPKLTIQKACNDISEDARAAYRVNFEKAKRRIILLLVLAFLICATAAHLLGKRIVKPLETMTHKIRLLSAHHRLFTMEDAYRTGDEIEVLAESFAKLSDKTVRYVEKIQQITAEKERISTELAMANAIQSSPLPQIFPPFPDRKEFDLYATMRPAKEVGGDFYDFFLVDHDHIGLVMADVSGKGVPAALFMMIAKTLIKNRVSNGESPASAMCTVNEQLQEGNDAGMFVTVWLCVLELSTGKGIVANAGHEHPALKRAGGRYELIKYKHSPAMGTMDGIDFKEHEFQMNPGDCFFVYTDGVAEATNAENELFGTTRMLDALNKDPAAPPRQILSNVMAGIREFVGEAEQFDDITMLCLKYVGPN